MKILKLLLLIYVFPRTALVAALVLIVLAVPPAAKVAAVSVAVYGIIQALKQAKDLQPYLTGWKALAINAAFCIVGVVVVTPPDQLYTWATVASIGQALAGAAGIHGTISKLSGNTDAPAAKS